MYGFADGSYLVNGYNLACGPVLETGVVELRTVLGGDR